MNEAYMIKYEQLVISNDFSQIMKFIKELQTDVTEEKINWYFHLLKDKRNTQLFLTLRAFFDKYGDVGKLFLLDYLKKSKDVALTAEAIILLSGHNYQCKEVLPKEDEKGVHSNDNPETIRAKALKLLEKELLR